MVLAIHHPAVVIKYDSATGYLVIWVIFTVMDSIHRRLHLSLLLLQQNVVLLCDMVNLGLVHLCLLFKLLQLIDETLLSLY